METLYIDDLLAGKEDCIDDTITVFILQYLTALTIKRPDFHRRPALEDGACAVEAAIGDDGTDGTSSLRTPARGLALPRNGAWRSWTVDQQSTIQALGRCRSP